MNRVTHLVVLLAFLLPACSPTDSNEKFIQGLWTASGTIDDEHAWLLGWGFGNGSFTVQGYPSFQHSGNYEIVSSEGDTLVLKLIKQKGDWPTADREITISIDRVNDTLIIDNLGPFVRSKPL